jgi:uncharacterized protein (TIGR02453 family)
MSSIGTRQPHFSPSFFHFLCQLAKNNSREWFLANKPMYEEHVKTPMLRFITDLKPRMAKISPRIDVDPKPVGGSMQRLNRDTRFSKAQSPYKTIVGAMFGHDGGGDLMLGYRMSLAPGDIKAFVGLWEPDGPTLDKIRTRIMVKPDEWKKVVGGNFAAQYTFEGESLKRPPKVGSCAVEADHSLIDDLKRKSHAAAATFDEKAVCSEDFLDEYVQVAKLGSPLMSFLCGTLKLPY